MFHCNPKQWWPSELKLCFFLFVQCASKFGCVFAEFFLNAVFVVFYLHVQITEPSCVKYTNLLEEHLRVHLE